jgi:hypothetical protein
MPCSIKSRNSPLSPQAPSRVSRDALIRLKGSPSSVVNTYGVAATLGQPSAAQPAACSAHRAVPVRQWGLALGEKVRSATGLGYRPPPSRVPMIIASFGLA